MGAEIAMGGFDPVAYHTEGRPREGTEENSFEWNGKTWVFASPENRRAFAENPEKYAPAYDGQCAFATSLGKEQPGSHRHWRIVDGRLFLQSNPVAGFLFRLIPGRIRAADERWNHDRSRSR